VLRPGQHLRARQRRVAIDVDDVVVLRARTQGDAPDRQARVAGGILHPRQRRTRRDAQAQPAAVCATVQATLFQRLEQCQDRPHQQRRHDRRRIKAGDRSQANRRHRPQSSGGGRPADHLLALQEQEGAGTGETDAAGHLRGDAQWIEHDARPPRHVEEAERGHDHRHTGPTQTSMCVRSPAAHSRRPRLMPITAPGRAASSSRRPSSHHWIIAASRPLPDRLPAACRRRSAGRCAGRAATGGVCRGPAPPITALHFKVPRTGTCDVRQ